MAKYLVLQGQHIEVSTNHLGLSRRMTNPVVFGGAIPVWHNRGDAARIPREATVFASRVAVGPYVREINFLIEELQKRFGHGVGYIALGASPKLVKWAIKARHLPVCTLSVSRPMRSGKPSAEFLVYLNRKLDKLGPVTMYVLLDFVDTGTSLAVMAKIIRDQRPRTRVVTAATGVAPREQRFDIDFQVALPNLSSGLFSLVTKHFLGRHKPKNALDTWSAYRNQMNADQRLPHSLGWRNGLGLTGQGTVPEWQFYEAEKRLFAEEGILNLPPIDLSEQDVQDLLSGLRWGQARCHSASELLDDAINF